jgi:hypothetical protein
LFLKENKNPKSESANIFKKQELQTVFIDANENKFGLKTIFKDPARTAQLREYIIHHSQII